MRIGTDIIMTTVSTRRALDYHTCRYGDSRLDFRGPAVSLDEPFMAVVGGSEVFGRYVEDPFVDQIAERSGLRVVNLGVMNGGLDAFVRDPAVMAILGRADTVIVQALGAHNLCNRHYMVHPRRNDRFLRQSAALAALYREVDFSEFTFTRHMLMTLKLCCPERFQEIEIELRLAWQARMKSILYGIPGRKILLSITDRQECELGCEPIFVTDELIGSLGGSIDAMMRFDATDFQTEDRRGRMVYPESDRAGAVRLLTATAHDQIADQLFHLLSESNGLAA